MKEGTFPGNSGKVPFTIVKLRGEAYRPDASLQGAEDVANTLSSGRSSRRGPLTDIRDTRKTNSPIPSGAPPPPSTLPLRLHERTDVGAAIAPNSRSFLPDYSNETTGPPFTLSTAA
jgi:hypothetical protein